jgi:hypothetical protein
MLNDLEISDEQLFLLICNIKKHLGEEIVLKIVVKDKQCCIVVDRYLFSWDDVPGTDSETLLKFTKDNFGITWTKNAEINKTDNNKIIQIREDNNLVIIKLNEMEKKATLEIGDGRTHDLMVKRKNEKLNIYSDRKEVEIGKVGNHEQVKVDIHKDNFPVDLFIFVIFNGELNNIRSKGCHIFDFEDFEMYAGVEKEKKDLTLSYEIKDQKQAIVNGESKYGTLIPNKLSDRLEKESDKFGKRVWIYCDSKDVNSIWEWLYFSPKTSDNAKNEQKRPRHRCIFKRKPRIPDEKNGFFWGDRFFLVRVSENYLFQEELFKIAKLAYLGDDTWPYVEKEGTLLNTLCTGCQALDFNFDNLHSFIEQNYEGAHVALGNEKAREILDEINNLGEPTKELYLLFLNICNCNQDLRSAFVSRIPTKAWIDTSCRLSEEIVKQCDFSNYFYHEFCENRKNVVEAATEARKKIYTEGNKNLWRLAYVVNGNPYIKAK